MPSGKKPGLTPIITSAVMLFLNNQEDTKHKKFPRSTWQTTPPRPAHCNANYSREAFCAICLPLRLSFYYAAALFHRPEPPQCLPRFVDLSRLPITTADCVIVKVLRPFE